MIFNIRYLVFATLMVCFCSCQNNPPAQDNNVKDSPDSLVRAINPDLPAPQRSQAVLFNQYIYLKNMLVATKKDEARIAAANMRVVLDTLTILKDSAQWQADKNKMTDELRNIIQAKTMDTLRWSFSRLSDIYYDAIGHYGLYTGKAYREYCPMAFDSKGAYWLSAEEKIKNPYFGDEMLECGDVKDTLK